VAAEIQKQIQVAGEMPMGSSVAANEAVPTLDSLIDKVGGRNIFGVLTKGGGGGDTNIPPDKVEKSSDLKLMGISLDSAEPGESIAIIKNKPDSKTYFVKIGQAVGDTGYTLQRVLPDRVVLKGRKQELELTGPSRSRSSN
jgi:type II secretory pathway component PulC